MNKYPMKGMMDQAAKHGRFGDSMLVHMNPVEVAGIASLSPTGKLTTNPVTGQPEAFLPFLIPVLASMGGSAAAGAGMLGATMAGAGAISAGTGAAIAGGLASGVATGAMTGDWERAGVSAVMGAGIGSALGAAGGAADAALDPAIADAAALENLQQVAAENVIPGMAETLPSSAVTPEMAIQPEAVAASELLPNSPVPAEALSAVDREIAGIGTANMTHAVPPPGTFTEELMAPFQEGSGLTGELLKKRSFVPIAYGASSLADMDAADAADAAYKKSQKGKGEEYNRMAALQQEAWRKAQPNLNARSAIPGMAAGGIVGYKEGGKAENPYDALGIPPATSTIINPLAVQAGLRGKNKVPVPGWHRPGFDPEIDYFQDYNESNGEGPQYPSPTSQQDWLNMYPPLKRLADLPEQTSAGWGDYDPDEYTGPVDFYGNPYAVADMSDGDGDSDEDLVDTDTDASLINPNTGLPYGAPVRGGRNRTPGGGRSVTPGGPRTRRYADGGNVQLNTDLGAQEISPGGIAEVPNQYTEAPAQPTPEDLVMVESAITGAAGEQSDQIIQAFIEKFGNEVYMMVREMILKSIDPAAQTKGMVSGQGGGMDDMVPGMVGGDPNNRIAVSPGEYIVPADVVSGLGDGSSEAGSAELDGMMDRVRMQRGGTTKQPAPFNARKVLPR